MNRCLLFLIAPLLHAAEPCRIEIVDKESGWPVPLVELRTTHEQRFISDNAGLIAIDDPDLLDRAVWFHLKGHGYGVKKDGFSYEGIRTSPVAGGTIRIEVERRNIAKRLGRLTGGGLFAESEKLGEASPLPESGIFGCDSVLMTRHDGKLFWLWGDTTLPGYPLGVFHSTAATTSLAPVADFKPPLTLPYTHFRDSEGNQPGNEPKFINEPRLVATYSKIKGHLDEYEFGLCVWNSQRERFEVEKVLWKGDGEKPVIPRGHPLRWKDDAGKEWMLFGDPFPTLRCPATFEDWKNPATWEKLPEPAAPRSAEDGSEVKPHRGSVAWNPFRKKWITVFTQHFGKPSAFGGIWYAEADVPMGPWGKAVKILTHDNYTFYNPRIHPELTPDDANFIVFEGTYTAEFADRPQPTPRYNYNQILYRLDLDDPKLAGAKQHGSARRIDRAASNAYAPDMSSTLTIRNRSEPVKQKLRIQAARHGRSMEAEAREILSRAVEDPRPAPPRTAEEMRERLQAVTRIWKDGHAGKSTDELMQELRGDD